MTMPMLPVWLQVLWAVALGLVVVLHVWHAATMGGQHRLWHTGHAVMALGMIAMYLFAMAHPIVSRVTLVVFCVMAAVLIAAAVSWRGRERVLNPLWVASVLDAVAMIYMSLPALRRPEALTWLFVTYLGLQALAWVFRLWGRLPLYRPERPAVPPVPAGTPAGTGGTATATATAVAAPRTRAGSRVTVGLSGRTTIDVALTLAVMAASMAYMLAAM